ncbi:hypothetical protein F5Y16DRAFT_48922 [Xylariaceae sp. FL0255]|nr:hypothetical protein F5Y16DRAFT_48922 [Xylariaceae sp. FL0255]
MSTNGQYSSMQAKARARAQDLLAYSQRQVDRVVSPPTRQRLLESITAFAARRPILSVLIATQLFFSAAPILLFLSFSLATLAFALLSAAAFSLFWIGVALLFLVPTLAVTGFLGLIAWVWVLAAYVAGRWAYDRFSPAARGKQGGPIVDFQKKEKMMAATNGSGDDENHVLAKDEKPELWED